jgi:hypothetical protein
VEHNLKSLQPFLDRKYSLHREKWQSKISCQTMDPVATATDAASYYHNAWKWQFKALKWQQLRSEFIREGQPSLNHMLLQALRVQPFPFFI